MWARGVAVPAAFVTASRHHSPTGSGVVPVRSVLPLTNESSSPAAVIDMPTWAFDVEL